jgi:hypothetical protein
MINRIDEQGDKRIFAVLSGDLVDSRQLNAGQMDALILFFRQGLDRFSAHFKPDMLRGPDFFRGDSWQMLVCKPHMALRLTLFIRAWLKSRTRMDTRISLGLGTVSHLADDRITESSGTAFELSGLGLDDLKEPHRLELSFGDGQVSLPLRESRMIMLYLDLIVSGWTVAEAFAVSGALLKETQEQIAMSSPPTRRSQGQPSRQAIGDALRRANWPLLEQTVDWFEEKVAASILAC